MAIILVDTVPFACVIYINLYAHFISMETLICPGFQYHTEFCFDPSSSEKAFTVLCCVFVSILESIEYVWLCMNFPWNTLCIPLLEKERKA